MTNTIFNQKHVTKNIFDFATLNPSWINNWEMAQELVYPTIISTERNSELLSEIPHIDIPNLRLSMIFKVNFSEILPVLLLQ